MPSDLKIDYFELPASNLDSVETFYSRVFGWTFEDYGPEYQAFSDGKINGGFYKAEQHSSTKNGAALVIFYAENLEKTLDVVVSNGGTVLQAIFSFPGGRRFQFSDPCGNELAVWSDQEPR